MSETYKDIEVSKRKWRITKFDAMTGALIVKKLLPVAASFMGSDVKKPEDVKLDVGSVILAVSSIKDEDFIYVQKACLKVVSEPLGAGFAPVMNDNGSFGVVGIENDTMTVLALVAHVLMFNVTGFFQDTPLASLAKGIMSSFQQSLQT